MHNLLDVRIQSVYLEISYFSTMESYIDLHLIYSLFASFAMDAFT